MTILVTGGTGTLGRPTVQRLRAAGHDVRILSRTPGPDRMTGDVTTGAGLAEAMHGIDTLVHLATSAGTKDVAQTRTVVDAARAAGITHLVFISIVGVDAIPYPYYRAKYESEQLIERSGIPYTILRATQFQESMLAVVKGLASLVIVPAPTGSRFQPIATDEVADRLVELARGEPAGLVPEMGGPKTYLLADLVRSYLAATGRHKPFISMGAPGKAAAALRDGANLTPDHAVGRRTWEEFLAREVG